MLKAKCRSHGLPRGSDNAERDCHHLESHEPADQPPIWIRLLHKPGRQEWNCRSPEEPARRSILGKIGGRASSPPDKQKITADNRTKPAKAILRIQGTMQREVLNE